MLLPLVSSSLKQLVLIGNDKEATGFQESLFKRLINEEMETFLVMSDREDALYQ